MHLPDNLPDGVRIPLQRLLAELGKDSFSINDIIGYIERNRQKTLRIEQDDMPISMTGYAVALADCDLICTRHNLSEAQRLVTKLHEMAHFLRGDILRFSVGEETTTYNQFIHERDQHILSARRERFIEMYNTQRELETELLARVLLKYIRTHEQNLPPAAQQLYHMKDVGE